MSRLVIKALRALGKPKSEQFVAMGLFTRLADACLRGTPGYTGRTGTMMLGDYNHLVPKIKYGPFKHLDFSNKSQFKAKILTHLFY